MKTRLKAISFYGALLIIGYIGGSLIGTISETDCKAAETNIIATNPPEETLAPELAPETVETAEPQDFSETEWRDVNGDVFLGSKDAKVTMIEYTDYQCPYCQRYFFAAYQELKNTFVKEGKVKYAVKAYPLPFHESARPAAYATFCAAEQGQLFHMHEALFMFQNEWSYSKEPEVLFSKYATTLGLNSEQFTTCMNNSVKTKEFDEKISTYMTEAGKLNISGTPSLVVNQKVIIGAQPYETFMEIIERELKELNQ